MKALQQSDANDTSNNAEFQNSNVSEPERADEAMAREILHNTGNLVLLKDADGRYLFVNRQFEKTFHVRQEEVKGKTDDEMFPPEQATAFGANDLLRVQAAVPMESKRQRLRTMAHIRPIVRRFPLINTNGKVYAIGKRARSRWCDISRWP